MKAQELIRRLKKYARKNDLSLVMEPGQGDHVKIWLDGQMSVLPGKRGEIPLGTFRAICKQLGVDHKELS
ncbi:MAG: type II toxin-antitoxin system HicA family toxin [Alphaproteobacteria bacterium]